MKTTWVKCSRIAWFDFLQCDLVWNHFGLSPVFKQNAKVYWFCSRFYRFWSFVPLAAIPQCLWLQPVFLLTQRQDNTSVIQAGMFNTKRRLLNSILRPRLPMPARRVAMVGTCTIESDKAVTSSTESAFHFFGEQKMYLIFGEERRGGWWKL